MNSDEGSSSAGSRSVPALHGNNARLGWTYTDNYADISSLYVERFDDPRRRSPTPTARHADAETWTEAWRSPTGNRGPCVLEDHHGPVVGLDEEGRPLAAKIARLEDGGWFAQLDAMIRARSLEEFQAAVGRLSIAYMNLMYADADGNIWYLYGSAVPRREPSFDWWDPVDGSDPRTEWGDYHPLSDLPQS
jgi:acyl-homoserine lactone acylase PvdQ